MKDKLDTGDLVYMKFECMNMMSVQEMMKCNLSQWVQPYPHYDTVGVVYRSDEYDMKVVYYKFGEVKSDSYVELLSQPHWSEFSGRKLYAGKEYELVIQKAMGELVEKVEKSEVQVKSVNEFMRLILNTLTISEGVDEELIPEDLDEEKPMWLKKGMKLGSKMGIRTKTNKLLQS